MFIALWLKGLKLHACLSQVPPARLAPPAPQVISRSCCRPAMYIGPRDSTVSSSLHLSSGLGGGCDHAVFSVQSYRKLLMQFCNHGSALLHSECMAFLSAMFTALWLKGLKLHACLSQVPPARLAPPAPQVISRSCCRPAMYMGPRDSTVSSSLQSSSGLGGGCDHVVFSVQSHRKLSMHFLQSWECTSSL